MATRPDDPHPSLYYKPRGAARRLWDDESPEVLLSGPAGTGKSRACLEKIYYLAETVPGLRALICRQVRASLTETGLATWENLILPPRHPCRGNASRAQRVAYHFPNGSQVNVGGLDRPDKIMSSEYDLIYPQEATELKEEGLEALTTRLRNGRLHYQQLLADCNPSAPTHWLKKRCDAGRCKMLDSRHEDNPRLHDGSGWTTEGLRYLSVLDNLTGARKQRLRHGRWVQAEGVVYEGWDAGRHLIDRFTIPPSWPRYLALDFGYTNPFVCWWFAKDPDGRLYGYREIYRTKRLVEDHAKDVVRLSEGEPKPEAVFADHDAEDRATFQRHSGLSVRAAVKNVSTGIQAVEARLSVAGDGKPRLFLFRDSLVERDRELDAAKKPTCTAEEFDAYVWARGVDGKAVKEEPVKEHDHGLDALRYLIFSLARPPAWAGTMTL